jgi:hypothetical protein
LEIYRSQTYAFSIETNTPSVVGAIASLEITAHASKIYALKITGGQLPYGSDLIFNLISNHERVS